MKNFKLLMPVLLWGILSGCTVTNYHSSSNDIDVLSIPATESYNIAKSQAITVQVYENSEKLSALEVKLLKQMMKLKTGEKVSDTLEKDLEKYDYKYKYHEVIRDNTVEMNLSCQMANPVLFSNSDKSIPVNARSMVVLSAEKTSVAWMIPHLLTLGLICPMKTYNYGALLVIVTDAKNEIIGTKMCGLYRSSWYSTLFPLGLFSLSKVSGTSAFFQQLSPGESSLQTTIAVNAIADILRDLKNKQPAEDKRWPSIKFAVVESLANGDGSSASQLLKSAVQLDIKSSELSDFCKLLGVSEEKEIKK